MIAQELEVILHRAFVGAREMRHATITTEHLLLALLNSPDVAQALRACGADLGALRGVLSAHITKQTPEVVSNRDADTQPNAGFQRVIQRAIVYVQSSGKKEVNSTDVLQAIFGEKKDCQAVQYLQQQGVNRRDLAIYISQGVGKVPLDHLGEAANGPSSADGSGIGRELEVSLHVAFVEAREKRHEFITVEHLLLALLDNPTAAEVLRACNANNDELRSQLTKHIDAHTPRIPIEREVDTQPTLGFQRVVQRAILHVQSSGKTQVSGANVLVAIFGEKDSHAVYFLQQQGVTRLNIVTFLSHGVLSERPAAVPVDASDVQVVLYNDESTPIEFMVRLLQEFFGMDKEEAAETLLDIYRDGKAACGLYSREDGESLVRQVLDLARENGYALRSRCC